MFNQLSTNLISATYFLLSTPERVNEFRSIMDLKARNSSRVEKDGLREYSFNYRRSGVEFSGEIDLIPSGPHPGILVTVDCDAWLGPDVKKIATDLEDLLGGFKYSKCLVSGLTLHAPFAACYPPEDIVMVVRNAILPNVGGEFVPVKLVSEGVEINAEVFDINDSENNDGEPCLSQLVIEFISLEHRRNDASENLYRAFRSTSFGYVEGVANSLPDDLILKAAQRGLNKSVTGNHEIQDVIGTLLAEAKPIVWEKPHRHNWSKLLKPVKQLKAAGFRH